MAGRNGKGHFQVGEKWDGNAKGRPKGSRNQLGEAFVADLYADWQKHGPVTITKVRETRPADFLRVIASIIPQQLNVAVSAVESMTNDELTATIRRLSADPEIIQLDDYRAEQSYEKPQ